MTFSPSEDNLRPDEDVKADLIVDLRKKLEPLFEKEVYADCELGQLLKNIKSILNMKRKQRKKQIRIKN